MGSFFMRSRQDSGKLAAKRKDTSQTVSETRLEDESLITGSKMIYVERNHRCEICEGYSVLKMLNLRSLRSTSTSHWMYSRLDSPTMVDTILIPLRRIGYMR